MQAIVLVAAVLALASLAASAATVEVWIAAPGLQEGSLEVDCGDATVNVHTAPSDGPIVIRVDPHHAQAAARILPCVMEKLNLTEPATLQSPVASQAGIEPESIGTLGGEPTGWTGKCPGPQCTTTTLTCTTAECAGPAATGSESAEDAAGQGLAASSGEGGDAYRLAVVALAGIVGGFAAAVAARW